MQRTVSMTAVILLLLAAGFTSPAKAQVTLDTNSSSHTASASSITWTHTVGSSATNVVLLVAVSLSESSSADVSSVAWSGTSPTFTCLAAVTVNGSGNTAGSCGSVGSSPLRRTEIWGAVLGTPATKTGTITVTLSASNGIVAGSASFSGAAQTSTFGTDQTAAGTSPTTASLTFSGLAAAPNTVVMDSFATNASGTGTPGSGQTSFWGTAGTSIWGGSSYKAGTSSIAMSETNTGTNFGWAYVGVPINPAPKSARKGQVITGKLDSIGGIRSSERLNPEPGDSL